MAALQELLELLRANISWSYEVPPQMVISICPENALLNNSEIEYAQLRADLSARDETIRQLQHALNEAQKVITPFANPDMLITPEKCQAAVNWCDEFGGDCNPTEAQA